MMMTESLLRRDSAYHNSVIGKQKKKMKRATITNITDEIESYFKIKTTDWLKDKSIYVNPKKIYDLVINSIDLSKYSKTGYYSHIQTGGTYRKILEPTNPISNLSKRLSNGFRKTKSYKNIANQKTFENPINLTLLDNFVLHYFYYLTIQEFEINPVKKNEIISDLLDVIKNSKYKSIKRLICQGLIVETGNLDLIHEELKIRIRKPSAVEFGCHSRELKSSEVNTIIELEFYHDSSHTDYYNFYENFSSAIRIYTLSSFFINSSRKQELFSNLIRQNNSSTIFQNSNSYKGKIKNTDQRKIQQFINLLLPYLTKVKANNEEKDTFIYSLKLAIDHYEDCLLNEKLKWQKRIMQSIMGLEALWLSDSDKETIGYKLKIRSSKVLVTLGLDEKEVPKHFNIAYSIRSSYAHGSPIKSELTKKISKGTLDINVLQKQMLNYLRLSIAFCLLLIEENKKEFINDLTKAIYDEKVNKEMKSKMKSIRMKLDKCLPLTLDMK